MAEHPHLAAVRGTMLTTAMTIQKKNNGARNLVTGTDFSWLQNDLQPIVGPYCLEETS